MGNTALTVIPLVFRTEPPLPTRPVNRHTRAACGCSIPASFGAVVRSGMRTQQHIENDIQVYLGWPISSDKLFHLDYKDLERHLFVVGQTGSGKSTLLKNLTYQLTVQDAGVTLIDPHGDLCEEVLRLIPNRRFDDVVYLDAADPDFAVALDWFGRSLPKERREPVASAIVAAFRGFFGDSWGPRLEMILSASLLALLEVEGQSLLGLQRLLEDASYREHIVSRVTNPMVKSFFENQMGKWDKRQFAEFVGPVLNKVSRLFLHTSTRGLCAQVKTKVNVRFMMDDRRILLCNLAKGRIGEDSASLLGAMLIALFEQSALSRADIPERDRVPHTLIVDEFHNFATTRFATAFSELRKYKLSVVACGQYLQQTLPEIRDAIFGNCGLIIAMRTGAEDAEILRKQLGDDSKSLWWYKDMPNYEAIVRRMTRIEDPWKIRMLPPLREAVHDGKVLKRLSREKYAVRRTEIENKIVRWLER